MARLARIIGLMALLVMANGAVAAELFVAPNGTPQGQGTRQSPWDIASVLGARQKIARDDP